MTLSAFGQAALEYAAQGMAVFPLAPRSKVPLFPKRDGAPGGFHDATTNADTIRQWWTAHPTANIGGVPASAGLVALDVDSAACWSQAMSLGLLSEPTHRVTTGTAQPGADAAHLYFRHPAPASDTKLGDIIVRSGRGYVVLPPSVHPVTGRVYTSDTTIADAIPLPDRAAVLLMAQQTVTAASERATVALTDVVTPGGRHEALVAVAGKLAAHGLTGAEGAALLAAYNATHCRPPKGSEEVGAIWEYVAHRETVKREDRAARHALVDLSALTAPVIDRARTVLRVSELMQGQPDIPFLVHNLLPEQGIGVLWAPAGAGKTFTTLDIALHVATGRDWQGRVTRPGCVLYVVGEGFLGMRARVAAWCAEHGVETDALEDTFFTRRLAWDITSQASRYEVLTELQELHARPDLVVIDTLSANGPAGFDDSSTADMKALMDAARIVRDSYPATVLFTHHSGHDTSRMRGSTDIIGTVDVSLKLTPAQGGAVTLSVEKARDFMKPDPIPLMLVPAHGAQVVRSGDAVDLTALTAVRHKPTHLTVLTAIADAGRAMKSKELEEAAGGKYVYAVLKELASQQLVWSPAPAIHDLTHAGREAVRQARPVPVIEISQTVRKQSDDQILTA